MSCKTASGWPRSRWPRRPAPSSISTAWRPDRPRRLTVHGDQDKIYYVLEGAGRFTLGAEDERLEAGDALVAPAGVEHGLVNDGGAPLLVLVVVTPPPPHVKAAGH
jgi:mannose-6-phosphate isomerase-like protein (cupin superfamily)